MTGKNTIRTLIEAKDWAGLDNLFARQSNADFRRTEALVRDSVMPHLSNGDFWETYMHLLMYRRQSFLACVCSISGLAGTGELDFDCPQAVELAQWLYQTSPESVAKVVRMAVPSLVSGSQILALFRLFGSMDEKSRVAVLVKETSPHAYYALFETLRQVPDDRQLQRAACLAVMRKSDDLSFNMASILKSYFGLDDIRSSFSLRIEPYELSSIDKSYDNFLRVLTGKRPQV